MGFTPCKAEQPLQGMELQENKAQSTKRENNTGNLFKTVDIDILVTSRNSDRKNHVIYQNKEQTSFEKK